MHSNSFPDIFNESVNIVIRQENKLYHEQTLDMTEPSNYHDFFIGLDRPGEFKFTCDVLNTAYKGFDQIINFSYKVNTSSELREV